MKCIYLIICFFSQIIMIMNQCRRDAANYQKTLNAINQSIDSYKSEINSLKKVVNDLTSQVESINQENTSLKGMIKDDKNSITQKITEIENNTLKIKNSNSGLIGYFENECPEGWVEFVSSKDRFILSAGTNYHLGTFGGQSEVSLTIDQMPAHTHSYTDPKVSPALWAGPGRELGGDRYREYPTVNGGTTTSTGLGKPHNNMPPYIVLKSCKKQ
jgi:hypothetical protein